MPFEFNAENYQQQLSKKIEKIKLLLTPFNAPEITIFSSADQNFRMRAEFRMWHDENSIHPSPYPVMFNKDNKKPQRIDKLPIACHKINDIVEKLPRLICNNHHLKDKLFQIDCMSSRSGEALLSLIYHKPLDNLWQDEAITLSAALNTHIVGRSHKQKIIVGRDYIQEVFTVNNQPLYYKQQEGSFTQPNAGINEKMLNWVFENTQGIVGDALELYCGNGNFTLVLSKNFQRVFATEIVKSAVQIAQENIALNNIENCAIARLSSEEFNQAFNAERTFRRLKNLDIFAYNFSTVLVDPPRSGLDQATCSLITTFDNILYISCNPYTLHENLKILTQTHQIKNAAIFDQFPYTAHVECGLLLSRK